MNYGGNRLLQRGTLFESRTVVRLGLGKVFPKEKRAEEAEEESGVGGHMFHRMWGWLQAAEFSRMFLSHLRVLDVSSS